MLDAISQEIFNHFSIVKSLSTKNQIPTTKKISTKKHKNYRAILLFNSIFVSKYRSQAGLCKY